MTRATITLATLFSLAIIAAPPSAEAGGYVGVGVGTGGFSLSLGGSNWGLWSSSWGATGWSVGLSAHLDGYGSWVHVGGLGRVWRPHVAVEWRPYSHGRWVWTSMGWTWVAYEPWGWIPHHYGNWAYTTVGWVWAPGTTYHPGNVVWVSSGGYMGWIPCGPPGWSHAHRAYHHGWRDGSSWGHHNGYNQGYRDGWRDARYATWVPRSRVTAGNVSAHAVGHDVATRSVARSRIAPMAAAPSKTEVERMTGRRVTVTAIEERSVTIDGTTTRAVRPVGQVESIRRHGGETVERALDRDVGRRATLSSARPDTRTRSVSDAPAPRTNAAARAPEGSRRTWSSDRRSEPAARSEAVKKSASQRTAGSSTVAAAVRRGSGPPSRNRTPVSTRSAAAGAGDPPSTPTGQARSARAPSASKSSTNASGRTAASGTRVVTSSADPKKTPRRQRAASPHATTESEDRQTTRRKRSRN